MPEGRDFSDFLMEELETNPEFAEAYNEQANLDALIDAMVAARVGADLTQTALAERMGVRQFVISRFESGDDDTKFSTIQRYADATGLPGMVVVTPRSTNRWDSVADYLRKLAASAMSQSSQSTLTNPQQDVIAARATDPTMEDLDALRFDREERGHMFTDQAAMEEGSWGPANASPHHKRRAG